MQANSGAGFLIKSRPPTKRNMQIHFKYIVKGSEEVETAIVEGDSLSQILRRLSLMLHDVDYTLVAHEGIEKVIMDDGTVREKE